MLKTGKLVMAAMVALVLSGAPAWVGAEQGKSTMEEAKGKVSDSWITGKTKIALYADDRVSGTQINVDTMQGMVHLRGKVDSAAAKAAAEEVARGIEGVRGVKNELQVVPASSQKLVEAKDEEITKQVKQRFEADPKLKSLDVRADNGVVTLQGKLPSIADSARASQMAREVPGVRAVRNDTTYEHPRTSMDRDRSTTGSRSDRSDNRMARSDSKDSSSMSDASTGRTMKNGGGKNGAGMKNGVMKNDATVRAAQEALEDKGFNPGPIDGIWGPKTSAAVSDFQRKENLTISGRLDPPTLAKLEIEADGTPAGKRQKP
jgi:hyperosmotically inducible protein